MESHTDKHFADYIIRGLVRGFRVGFVSRSKSLKVAPKNYPSATAQQSVVSECIETEVYLGRLVGLFPDHRAAGVHVTPIGLIPKPHQKEK